MNKKTIAFILVGLVSILALTGFVYAERLDGSFSDLKNFRGDKNDINDEMINIMRQNGYEDIAESVENGDYEKMDEFMNNMTDEDYEKMTKIMKENGYDHMSDMMESIGKDEMIEMHNSMDGAESCH